MGMYSNIPKVVKGRRPCTNEGFIRRRMNRQELAKWLLDISIEPSPWGEWFDRNYCQRCASVVKQCPDGATKEYSYCEENARCRYQDDFPKDIPGEIVGGVPDGEFVINLWMGAISDRDSFIADTDAKLNQLILTEEEEDGELR